MKNGIFPEGWKQDPQLAGTLEPFIAVLEYLSGFSVPLMLIANFARIMNNDGEYKHLLLSNGAAAILVMALLFLEVFRITAGRFLVNAHVDLNQVDEWVQMIRSPGR